MNTFTPPTSPPPPLTAAEEAIVREAHEIIDSLRDKPRVSKELQERVSEEPETPSGSAEPDQDQPLL